MYDAHLSSARHQKLAKKHTAGGAGGEVDSVARQAAAEHARAEQTKRVLRAKLLARDESMIRVLGDELRTVREETRSNVERKAALTDRERQEEAESLAREESAALAEGFEAADEAADDDSTRPDRIYNPLKLPLDFDGKPIPLWMYKLQGLSREYKCEICSDFVYRGRCVAVREHADGQGELREALPGGAACVRHARARPAEHGPVPRHHAHRGRIRAYVRGGTLVLTSVAEKLQRQEREEAEDPADMEEVEDEHGNVSTLSVHRLRCRHIPGKRTSCSSGKGSSDHCSRRARGAFVVACS